MLTPQLPQSLEVVKCCGNAGVQGTRRDLREHLSHSLLFKGSTLGISLTQREKKKCSERFERKTAESFDC